MFNFLQIIEISSFPCRQEFITYTVGELVEPGLVREFPFDRLREQQSVGELVEPDIALD